MTEDITTGTEGGIKSEKNNKQMPKQYADCILAILGEQPGIKRGLVFDRLVYRLNLDFNDLPSDFPSKEKVNHKVSNFKRGGHKPKGQKAKGYKKKRP